MCATMFNCGKLIFTSINDLDLRKITQSLPWSFSSAIFSCKMVYAQSDKEQIPPPRSRSLITVCIFSCHAVNFLFITTRTFQIYNMANSRLQIFDNGIHVDVGLLKRGEPFNLEVVKADSNLCIRITLKMKDYPKKNKALELISEKSSVNIRIPRCCFFYIQNKILTSK